MKLKKNLRNGQRKKVWYKKVIVLSELARLIFLIKNRMCHHRKQMQIFFSGKYHTFDVFKTFPEFLMIGAHLWEILSVMGKVHVWKLRFILCQYIYRIMFLSYSLQTPGRFARGCCREVFWASLFDLSPQRAVLNTGGGREGVDYVCDVYFLFRLCVTFIFMYFGVRSKRNSNF